MKFRHVSLISMASVVLLSSVGYAEMHAFSLPDGRALEAEIMDYNTKLGLVELKRADGKRVKVKPSVFVEEDQAYIREWAKSLAFRSPNIFKITCSDETVKKWKEEETQDIRYTDGTVEKDFTINVKKFEQIAYKIAFNNTGATVLQGMTLEYCIFYEQSKLTRRGEKPEMQQKTLKGKIDVTVIQGKSKSEVLTKPAEIYEDNLIDIPQGGDGDQRRPGIGDVHGIRGRLYLKAGDGSTVMREFSKPTSLSEKDFRWDS